MGGTEGQPARTVSGWSTGCPAAGSRKGGPEGRDGLLQLHDLWTELLLGGRCQVLQGRLDAVGPDFPLATTPAGAAPGDAPHFSAIAISGARQEILIGIRPQH